MSIVILFIEYENHWKMSQLIFLLNYTILCPFLQSQLVRSTSFFLRFLTWTIQVGIVVVSRVCSSLKLTSIFEQLCWLEARGCRAAAYWHRRVARHSPHQRWWSSKRRQRERGAGERYVAGQRLWRARKKKKIATSIIDYATHYATSYQANWFSTPLDWRCTLIIIMEQLQFTTHFFFSWFQTTCGFWWGSA